MKWIVSSWKVLASALLFGIVIGGGIIYIIENRQEQYWRERYLQQSKNNDSLKIQMEQLHKRNTILTEENNGLRNDLGVTILSSIRSNYYDLSALKSDNYNIQMYYNREEYKSNLVPKKIGEKWGINIFSDKYKQDLDNLLDTIMAGNRK